MAHITYKKELAENSRIYRTFARNNRPSRDDSHGWGHNSQWSTSFRRDYLGYNAYYYNVDGKVDMYHKDAADPGPPLPLRVELLTHRCFVVTPGRPYDEELGIVAYREPR